MAEDIYQVLGHAIDLWKIPTHGDNDQVEATEFWLRHSTNKIKVSTRQVSPQQRLAWLDERVQGEGDGKMSLLARFIWVEANAGTNTVSLSESVQQHILHKFGLSLAYSYFKSFYSGVYALPRVSKSQLDRRPYAFCFGPKRAGIWSHTIRNDVRSEPVSEGLLFLQSSSKKQGEDRMKGGTALQFQALIEKAPWNPDIVRSPTFPAYLNALVLSKEISMTLADIGIKVRAIEGRTGYHVYQNRNEGPSPLELGKLSAEASGYATKLASVTRKGKMVEKLLDFIVKMAEEDEAYLRSRGRDAADPPTGDGHLLRNNLEVLRERLEMQIPETDYALKRVQIQVDALFNIISQKDNLNNYKLSIWTKNISLVSQRDAASMKTLAFVTMFFLPGSFISALFSTPLFKWDDVDMSDWSTVRVGTTPQFGLYWAVTVPLTVVTFILYYLWLWWQHKQRKKREKALGISGESMEESKPSVNGPKKEFMVERDAVAQTRKETALAHGNSIAMTDSSTWNQRFRNKWKKDDALV